MSAAAGLNSVFSVMTALLPPPLALCLPAAVVSLDIAIPIPPNASLASVCSALPLTPSVLQPVLLLPTGAAGEHPASAN